MLSSMSAAGMRETDPTDAVLASPWRRGNDDVIAIADAGFGRMGRNHPVVCVVEQQPRQEMVAGVPDRRSSGPLIRELLLNRIEQCTVHDRRLLAGQDLVLVFDLADIEAIAQ